MKHYLHDPVSISVLKNSVEIGEKAAEKIIETVKKNHDAVIIIPTGSTPLPMYKALAHKYETDRTIDLSKARFFNLDEYLGLPEGHPLSYKYYMQKVLYEKLDRIDKTRAPNPENRHIPHVAKGQTPSACAASYERALHSAIASTGRKKTDLAVLGIGGAYPVRNKSGKYYAIRGGHLGFNEPGSKITDRTRVVKLTQKTRLDTTYRFLNLCYCKNIYCKEFPNKTPEKAITLGIANILESREILLLANMEEKEPVITRAYENDPDPDFPATFLKYHTNVHWLLDSDAASNLPHVRTPWMIGNGQFRFDKDMVRKAVIEVLIRHPKLALAQLKDKDLMSLGIDSSVIERSGGIDRIKADAAEFLSFFINKDNNRLLPYRKKIMIFSPHPDDDSIDMAHTIRKLIQNENDVWIVYMVNGENAVRNKGRAFTGKFKAIAEAFKARHGLKKIDRVEKEELYRQARVEIREDESRCAARYLGITENRIFFLHLPYYYHRGLVDVEPISPQDVGPVKDLLLQIQPHHIFYSAEADPHGAHGLCAEIIAGSLEKLLSFWHVSFWGYRGAYEEWPLHKANDLIIVPFTEKEMGLKIKCIKCHRSQLDPIFPSFDRREFYERARDRNRKTGHLLEQMGYFKKGPVYAEVFRKIAHAEFMRTK